MAEVGAAVMPVTVLTFLLLESLNPHLGPGLYLVTTIVLAFLVVLSATRMRSGGLYFASTFLLAFNHLDLDQRIAVAAGSSRNDPLGAGASVSGGDRALLLALPGGKETCERALGPLWCGIGRADLVLCSS